MNKAVKTALVLLWAGTSTLLNQAASNIPTMTTLIDWTQLGWCFAGSSAFVVWEIIQQVHRPGWHRAGLLFIGLVISLAANTYVSEKLGLPLQLCSAGLGALGYKVFTFGQKKTDKQLDKKLTEKD